MKVLARNPDKVTTVLKDLFDESEVEKHQENVTVVKGGISNEEALVELLTGVDTVLSFLGMVGDQSVWVVSPGVENIIAALKKVAESRFTLIATIVLHISLLQMVAMHLNLSPCLPWVLEIPRTR